MEQISVNLIPSGIKGTCHASQFDIGRSIRFALLSGSNIYTLSGSETITMKIRKPDGTERTETLANTSSTYVDLVTNRDTCDQSGTYDCEITVTDGGVVIGSGNFTMEVEADSLDGIIVVKTASGAIASFETSLPFPLNEAKFTLPYKAGGYTELSHFNSKTAPVIDTAPYQTRIAPSNIGNMALEKLVGVSCVFNQLWSEYTSIDGDYASITKNADNDYTLTVAQSSSVSESWRYGIHDTLSGISLISGHKYLFTGYFTASFNTQIRFLLGDEFILDTLTTNVNKKVGVIKECGSNSGLLGFIEVTFPNMYNSNIGDTVRVKNFNIFDLTAMFGTEVADYLYTLESGTAGTGVTLFKSLFGEEYYPYTANTLMSCKPLAKVIVGKNLFGGAYDTMFRLPFVVKKGTVISASAVKIGEGMPNVRYYDENQTQIDFWGLATTGSAIEGRVFRNFTLQADIYYVKFDTVEVTDMQFEIGAINTAFEPYSATTVNFSGTELRGILKVGTNGLYADGDTDDGSGTGAVRYGIVDLGSLDWTYYEYGLISGGYSTSLSTQLKQETGGDTLYNAISVLTQYTDDTFETSPDLTFAINYYGYVKVHVSGVTDSASLKSALSGKYLIYELATPTTQTISAWTNPIVAKEGGTETFVDGNEFSIVDLGSLTWSYSGSLKLFYAPLTPYPKGDGGCITNGYERIDGYTLATDLTQDKKMALGWLVDDKCINIRDLDYTDANDFKNAMSGKYLTYEISNSTLELPTGHDTIYGTDLVVKTADFGQTIHGGEYEAVSGVLTSRYNSDGTTKTTPDVIQKTPETIMANAGANNIWNDAGNSEVKYVDMKGEGT